MAQKEITYRSKRYRTFVESQPCIIDHDGHCRGDIVAHHTGARGWAIKADDRSAIPLCDVPHSLWHGPGGGRHTFEETYNVDIWRLVQATNWAYIKHLEEKK